MATILPQKKSIYKLVLTGLYLEQISHLLLLCLEDLDDALDDAVRTLVARHSPVLGLGRQSVVRIRVLQTN
jgi:hypothetical protein